MKVRLTVREVMDNYLWDKVCEMKGYSEWCVNEGLMSSDEEIEFSEKEAKELGLIKEKEEY